MVEHKLPLRKVPREELEVVVDHGSPPRVAEPERLVTFSNLTLQEFHQTHSILRLQHRLGRQARNLGHGRKDVHGGGRELRHARYWNARRPLDHCRHPQPALVERPLVSPQATHRVGLEARQAAIVAAEPHQGVLRDFQAPQPLPQRPDAAVHRRQLGVVTARLLVETGKEGLVPLQRHPRAVGRPVPDHREGRLLRLRLRPQELEGLRHDDFRRVACKLLELPLPAHHRIQVEEVRHRQPRLEAETTRPVGVIFQNRNPGPTQSVQMPLPEVPGGIARLPQGLRQRPLLLAQGKAVIEHPAPVGRASRQDRGTGR